MTIPEFLSVVLKLWGALFILSCLIAGCTAIWDAFVQPTKGVPERDKL